MARRPQRPPNLTDAGLLLWLLAQGVRSPSGCLLWPHSGVRGGRGMTCYKGRRVLVPRLLWKLLKGRWPKHHVLHTCDTPACFEAAHLVDGTQRDNMTDMATKRRHPTACKLTHADARRIRADPRPHAHIAPDYGVSAVMVGRIKRGQAWRE